jgi:branched-chain amino acid transport system permease protein
VARLLRNAFLALLLSVIFVPAGIAHAEGETSSISGVMLDKDGNPLEGVEFTVTRPDTSEITISSDATGLWVYEASVTGSFSVTINPDSLPSGVGLTEPDRLTKSVIIFALGNELPEIKFLTGEGPKRSSITDRALQLTLDGIILGVTIGLAAVGLSLIFGTTGLTNFAHGELVTLGGMGAYFFNQLGIHIVPAALLALLLALVLGGFVQDRYLWKPLRKRGTGLIAMLVVSIGLGLAARYVFLYIFGGDKMQYQQYSGQAGWQFGPFSLTPKALISTVIGILLIAAVIAWLLKSSLGKASRAVADNPALASASGIDVERVIMTVWLLGAVLAAYAGIIMGLNQGAQFIMGSDVLLLIFAAVTLGGLGTAYGAIVGSMIVGLFIQLSTLFIPTELKYVGALFVLIVILLVRPQGIMGRKERIG